MTTQKAYLETEKGERFEFKFNPEEFSLVRANAWESDRVPGKEIPDMRYAGGEPSSSTFSLVFDTTDTGRPVTEYTLRFIEFMKIDESLPGFDRKRNNGRPPWVKFHWGDLHSFKAVITSTDITYTYFSADGIPLRAKVAVSLQQYESDENWGPQNPTSGTPHPRRTHQVQVGETLDRIAAKHYGASTAWRDIAAANGLSDPLALRPGSILEIPERS